MHPPPRFAILLCLGMVAGCTVGPDYSAPSVALPEHFSAQTVRQVGAAEADLAAWWSAFNDPMLSQLVNLALQQNLDLAQASARIEQARAGLGAADAALLPSASVNGQAARARQSLETPLGQVLNSDPSYNRYGSAYEANLNASWELDVFGGLRRGQEAAFADYQASQAGAVATRLAVVAQTADLYLSIRGLQARLEIARHQVDTRQQLLTTIEHLYAKGLAAELQLNQTQGALNQAQATIPVLQTGLDAALNALDVMLGKAPGTYRAQLTQPAPIPNVPGLSDMGAPQDLLRRRPDLIVAERRLAASNARIGEAMSEYYPKLSVGALLGSATSVSTANLFSNGASQASAVLGLRWRLFDFGRINAQIDLAKGQEAEALAAYRQSVLRACEEVESAFSALIHSEQQSAQLALGESAYGKARATSFIAYEKGVVSLIEVLDADEHLLAASDAKAQAQTASARAAVATFKALGGGWQREASGGRVGSRTLQE
ncbi:MULTISPECIES: efflux transporter outer membrane subunit [Pseudomonas]|uniref:efflux transporter outer membrane subunit n=1 Tax=Pseudomonas TaxID=286 RepID=UPI000D00A17C|nr:MULTISPECIES: TolC family protein [Pseudomonas]PRA45843.1 RND transporter [Pseudomonas sp. MYb115]QXN52297.1 TolC family protein [Pseudomonas fluorescens]WSO26631.1 TolC family protein [Pseudomonas fluorescens]